MNNNKVKCMKVAKKYSKDYWDGIESLVMGDIFTRRLLEKDCLKIIKTYNLRKIRLS